MAHGIEQVKVEGSLVSLCGGTPASEGGSGRGWHGLLTVRPSWTVVESRNFMQSDREQKMTPYFWYDPCTETYRQSDRQQAITICDTDGSYREVGNCSPTYGLTTHGEILDLAQLIEDAGHKVATFGSLFGGSKMWIAFKVATADVNKSTPINTYLVLTQGIDGSTGISLLQTDVCVVCDNTLQAAICRAEMGKNGRMTTIKHTTRLSPDGTRDNSLVTDEVTRAIQAVLRGFDGSMEKYKFLDSVSLKTDNDLQVYANLLRGHAEDHEPSKNKDGSNRADGFFMKLQEAFLTSDGCGKTGSFFEAFMAYTWMLTHGKGKLTKGQTEEDANVRRFSELTLGGNLAKQAADGLAIAVSMAEKAR